MTAARPLRWILTASLRSPGTTARPFSNTPRVKFPRRRPQDIIRGQQQSKELSPRTAPYSATDLEELKSHFTPGQLSALLAGESAIDRTDFERRTQRRGGDPLSLKYLDDLSTLDPVLDLLPEGAQPPKTMNGKNEWISPPQQLPPINDPDLKYSEEDQEGNMLRNLAAHTGMPVTELKNVRSRIMVMHSVTNQTRMGKIRKVYCLAVAGNGNGLLGVGEGKATEGEDAIRQATYMAIRNMEPIPRYEGRTIYGDVEVKQGAVEMKIFTRPPGYGVRCSQYIFEMCRCLGIQDLSARVTRSRNPMNVIKTFMKALRSQKLPEVIARGRGKKFVDVRKVYYGGSA